MATSLDTAFWWDSLGKPDWYTLLADDFSRLEELAEQHADEPTHKQIKAPAYELVERAIRENHIPLATSGESFDLERKPIDTVVLHHTKNPSGITLERLNAIQLLRIYGSYYANPTDEQQYLKGRPVWSGHFYAGKQVFWGYHWLIREDGTAEQILQDSSIGWHAGNWDVNTRSIGICIDDDLSEKQPSRAALRAIATVILEHYPNIDKQNVVGHRDVNNRTICPGDLFHTAWRQHLLSLL